MFHLKITKGIDKILHYVSTGQFDKLFKSGDQFLAMGSLFIVISVFLLLTTRLN
jgi:hypothetical protein